MTDYEPYSGRKDYAFATAGGYYTVRLAIAEYLAKIKRQASVLAVRIITPEYTTPLGVWVTLAAARSAFEEKPIAFASRELMLGYLESIIKKRFGIDIHKFLNKSLLLKELSAQRKLGSYFT